MLHSATAPDLSGWLPQAARTNATAADTGSWLPQRNLDSGGSTAAAGLAGMKLGAAEAAEGAAGRPLELIIEDEDGDQPDERRHAATSLAQPSPSPSPSLLRYRASEWAPEALTKATSRLLEQRHNGPQQAEDAYGHTASRVCKRTAEPEWGWDFEVGLLEAYIDHTGTMRNPDAPFQTLRLELWHRLPWKPDRFLGEVSIPLGFLMDLEVHRGWFALSDPQGKVALPPRTLLSGEVFLELQYTDDV